MTAIVVDLDDCGLDTHTTLTKLHRELMPEWDLPDTFLTHDNAPCLKQILDDGTYMMRTPIKKGFEEVLRRLKDLGHTIYACTHRGFHPKGKEYTERLLAPMLDVFEEIFYLDPYDKECGRDKTKFLSQKFKNIYYLIDDNPGFGHTFDTSRVILFDTRWNRADKRMARVKDWNFLEVFGSLALTQSHILKVPFDGNFEHE